MYWMSCGCCALRGSITEAACRNDVKVVGVIKPGLQSLQPTVGCRNGYMCSSGRSDSFFYSYTLTLYVTFKKKIINN